MQSSCYFGEATKKLAGMSNEIVQGGKLGISQNHQPEHGGEADNRNTYKAIGKCGQGDGEEEGHRQFGKKGQREKKKGGESCSIIGVKSTFSSLILLMRLPGEEKEYVGWGNSTAA
ncbi:hypothetical protein AAES_34820 [Amazona aestiva]|uniref:Uncharacterized protein n=1 Tax=Amazona aestiva TaxID=12930 RepID=A0A0Q3UY40_AMAAE|nr:hypothetical protein AAES_34820 [Amazona aestiva]